MTMMTLLNIVHQVELAVSEKQLREEVLFLRESHSVQVGLGMLQKHDTSGTDYVNSCCHLETILCFGVQITYIQQAFGMLHKQPAINNMSTLIC